MVLLSIRKISKDNRAFNKILCQGKKTGPHKVC